MPSVLQFVGFVAAYRNPGMLPPAPGPIPVNCSNEVGEPVVKFRDAVSSDATATVHRQIGAEVVGNVQGTHLQWVRALGYSDEALIRAYQNRPEIEWVRPAPNRLKESSH